MVAPGDRVWIAFEATVQKVGQDLQVWVLANDCWFATDQWELLDSPVDPVCTCKQALAPL